MLDSTTTLDREHAPCTDDDRSCDAPHRQVDRLTDHDASRDTARDTARDTDHDIDHDAHHDARRLAHEIVARFVRDPATFAATVRAEAPAAFLHDYRQGLDRRLTAIVGAPKQSADRFATMGAPVIDAPADWLPVRRDENGVEQPDLSPRMGPVVVAVVTAACAVVTAVCAVVTAMSRHVQK